MFLSEAIVDFDFLFAVGAIVDFETVGLAQAVDSFGLLFSRFEPLRPRPIASARTILVLPGARSLFVKGLLGAVLDLAPLRVGADLAPGFQSTGRFVMLFDDLHAGRRLRRRRSQRECDK